MNKKHKLLDRKDLDIINILDRLGPKVSTKQLSRILNIPSRTVRYRLAKLRDGGFLQPLHVLTHERRLGLGENILVMQEERRKSLFPYELFEAIPYFYWYSPTYGKYNGHLVHSVFSLASPNTNFKLLRAMQRGGLISDYHIFEIVDYEVKSVNLAYFSPEHGWTWNWDKWIDEIEKSLRTNKKTTFTMEEKPSVVDFDFKDILILKHMLKDAKVTLKQLGGALNLSEAQVSKRVRRLEKKGIIKGYKSVFNPMPSEDLLSFHCFLELEEPVDRVLSSFYQLPYPVDILMESRNRFCIRLRLSASDFNGFLRGFDLLKPHIVSYFFQIVHHLTTARVQQVYNLFKKDTNCWETPAEKYVNKIEFFLHSKGFSSQTG